MSLSTSNSRKFVLAMLATSGFVLLLLLALVEIHLRRFAAVDDRRFGQVQSELANATAPWAAFGDSHVASGLVSNTWLDNFGQPSDNFEDMVTKIELRLKRGNLKGIILQADPQLFAFYRLTANKKNGVATVVDRSERFTMLQLLYPQHRQYLVPMVSTSVRSAIGPGREAPPVIPTKAHSDIDRSSEKWKKDAALRVQLHTPVSNLNNLDTVRKYTALANSLLARGLSVCLVNFPVSSDYREISTSSGSFQQSIAYFKRLSSESGAVLVDASSMFPDASFSDPDHLASAAAAALTLRLYERCGMAGHMERSE